jgi:small subunit ribosomal protein S12
MSRINYVIKNKRFKKKRRAKLPFFNSNPFKKALCLKVLKFSPKKPNSANRSVAKVRILSTNKIVYVAIPGINHNLQEHATVLIRGAGVRDLPYIRVKAVPGCFDFTGYSNRLRSRSKYGTKIPSLKVK